MKNEPWAMFTTFMSPNISDRPADIMNNKMPKTRPLTTWEVRYSMRRDPSQLCLVSGSRTSL